MRLRLSAAAAVVMMLLFGLSVGSPAQARHVIKIALSSYKFDPNLFFVNEGETVVLQLENIDPERPHSFDSPYLSTVDFSVSGQAKQGVTKDGTKYVELEPGQKGELTFVAKGRGQYGFICALYNHASRGQTGAFVVWPAGYHPPTP
ncbi:MAG TPA: cupredoxin domain-containing protein [bacterium]|nr:cupredoxin domain-containing protein [bacterium]